MEQEVAKAQAAFISTPEPFLCILRGDLTMQLLQWKQLKASLTLGSLVIMSLAIARPCAADKKWTTDSIIRGIVHEIVGVNGYWFTGSSAQAVLGTPKFASDTTLYVKPAHRYNMLVTG